LEKDCIRDQTKWKTLVEKDKNFSEVVAPQKEEEVMWNTAVGMRSWKKCYLVCTTLNIAI